MQKDSARARLASMLHASGDGGGAGGAGGGGTQRKGSDGTHLVGSRWEARQSLV